ncbi:glycosyltransferase family 2 protein [Paenibacillus sp. LS1]|uniref:glycosyltransferase family 2 protein n=1 Tax=Paenibacillus sp. LS1 TaxID=2992120 RepID=UPI00222FFD49|nr:glycosyltransferase family 2 protein [Paenibacillus sp. LS1]MCW3794898.1 glycosyltransferase family 2 protein [Paenibacillus sp. LS1]
MSTPDQQRGEGRHGRNNKANARSVTRRNGNSHHNITPNINSRSDKSRSEQDRNVSISSTNKVGRHATQQDVSRSAMAVLHIAGRRSTRKSRRKGRSNRTAKGAKLYKQGYNRGYDEGVRQGQSSFGLVFEGVSIIIPTYNQREYVLQCVSSIEKHTPAPFEIIVVDNASKDGTAEAMHRKGGMVRVAALDQNRGFAGGVNHGLMMARGRHIIVLNNDTLVTPGWLDNMMTCLASDPQIGVVGPVTNYIGGDQQIKVPYREVEDMWSFASTHNRPDAEKHRMTDRLVGFCWLFSRELLERVGYLDEGYAVGNFEDDDWIIRVKLAGYQLAVAGDAFIHHFGSVSMKALGEQDFAVVNKDNEQFYSQKWGDPHTLVAETTRLAKRQTSGTPSGQQEDRDTYPIDPRQRISTQGSQDPALQFRRSSDFYPEGSFLSDAKGDVYTLTGGRRRKLNIPVPRGISPVQVAKPDLLAIPAGEALISAGDVQGWPMESQQLQTTAVQGSPNGWAEGSIVAAGDAPEIRYQISGGKRRRFVSVYAAERWGIHSGHIVSVSADQLNSMEEGWPIIAPPQLLNPDL